jgi:hypothetical protein
LGPTGVSGLSQLRSLIFGQPILHSNGQAQVRPFDGFFQVQDLVQLPQHISFGSFCVLKQSGEPADFILQLPLQCRELGLRFLDLLHHVGPLLFIQPKFALISHDRFCRKQVAL